MIYLKEPVLSYRIKKVDAESRKVSTPQDAVPYVAELYVLGIERFIALYLDSKNKIRYTKTIEEGTINQANPIVREILRYGISIDAASIIVAHNHPSGDCEPSREDKEFTKTLWKAGEITGLKILDHLIVALDDNGSKGYYSFADHSLME